MYRASRAKYINSGKKANATVGGRGSLLVTFFSVARCHSREGPPCFFRPQAFFPFVLLFNILDINTERDG